MKIVDVLFPMRTVKISNYVPTVHVVLQRARTLIENLAGIDEEKEIA